MQTTAISAVRFAPTSIACLSAVLFCSWSNLSREGLSHKGRQALTTGHSRGPLCCCAEPCPAGSAPRTGTAAPGHLKGIAFVSRLRTFLALFVSVSKEIETLDKLFQSEGDFHKINYMQISSTLTCQRYGRHILPSIVTNNISLEVILFLAWSRIEVSTFKHQISDQGSCCSKS